MRVLLDTSYVYNLMEAPGKLADDERAFFARRDVRVYVSAVSIWEMRLKHGARHPSGARKSRFDPKDVIAVLEGLDIVFLPLTPIHAARSLEIPLSYKDPFDEMLLVQAQEEGLQLLTVVQRLVDHPLACTPLSG